MTRKNALAVCALCLTLALLLCLSACGFGGTAAPDGTGKPAQTDLPAPEAPPAPAAATAALRPQSGETENFIYDLAGLLGDDECRQLNSKAKDASLRFACGIYVAVFEDMAEYNYGSMDRFAEEVRSQWDLGIGDERECIALIMSMSGRDYYLYTHGDSAGSAFTGAGKELLAGSFTDNFRTDDWFGGFGDYISECAHLLEQAADGLPLSDRTQADAAAAPSDTPSPELLYSPEFDPTIGWETYLGTWGTAGSLATMTISPAGAAGRYRIEIGSVYTTPMMVWTYDGVLQDNRGIIECTNGSRTDYIWNDGMRLPVNVYDRTGSAELEYVYTPNGNNLRWRNLTDDLYALFNTTDLVFERSGQAQPSAPQASGSSWASLSMPFLVQTGDLPIYTGPGVDHGTISMTTGVGIYTITEVSPGPGSAGGWGRLKSGAGWINLDDCSLYS